MPFVLWQAAELPLWIGLAAKHAAAAAAVACPPLPTTLDGLEVPLLMMRAYKPCFASPAEAPPSSLQQLVVLPAAAKDNSEHFYQWQATQLQAIAGGLAARDDYGSVLKGIVMLTTKEHVEMF
eukprot:1159183-Pelagomonas_calceolata.AAC.14